MTGLPTVRIDDVIVHPRDNDLILATHGRSIYIMDDITALQQLTEKVMAEDVTLLNVRPATAWVNDIYLGRSAGGAKHFRGENARTRHGDQLLPEISGKHRCQNLHSGYRRQGTAGDDWPQRGGIAPGTVAGAWGSGRRQRRRRRSSGCNCDGGRDSGSRRRRRRGDRAPGSGSSTAGCGRRSRRRRRRHHTRHVPGQAGRERQGVLHQAGCRSRSRPSEIASPKKSGQSARGSRLFSKQ